MFTIKGCSLIRGVHYERFHCTIGPSLGFFAARITNLCLQYTSLWYQQGVVRTQEGVDH